MAIIGHSKPTIPIKESPSNGTEDNSSVSLLSVYRHNDYGAVFVNGLAETVKGVRVVVFTPIYEGKVLIQSYNDFIEQSTKIDKPNK